MNIDELPAGPELDRLIAEQVMGWKRSLWDDDDRGCKCWSPWMVPGCPPRFTFSPSTNIAHAMEVAEKIPGFFLYRRADGTWTTYGNPKHKGGPRGHGATAELSIARGALKVVMS